MPSLFPSSQVTEEPFHIDPYDGLHGVCLLAQYNKNLNEGKGQLKTKNPQCPAAISPQWGGAYGKGGGVQGATEAGLSTDRAADLDEYYFGALREQQRDLIMFTLNNPQETFATEEAVRMLTEHMGRASIDTNVFKPLTPMDTQQRKNLLDRSVGEHFIKENLVYKPTDMTPTPGISDI